MNYLQFASLMSGLSLLAKINNQMLLCYTVSIFFVMVIAIKAVDSIFKGYSHE